MHLSIPAATCTPRPSGNCGTFARLVSPRGGTNSEHPRGTPKKLLTCLKTYFLHFYMYFNLKSHNLKANGESVYKYYCCVLQQPAFSSLYRGFSCYHNFSSVFLVEFFSIIHLQRLPISFKTYCELRISENLNSTSKQASFLG